MGNEAIDQTPEIEDPKKKGKKSKPKINLSGYDEVVATANVKAVNNVDLSGFDEVIKKKEPSESGAEASSTGVKEFVSEAPSSSGNLIKEIFGGKSLRPIQDKGVTGLVPTGGKVDGVETVTIDAEKSPEQKLQTLGLNVTFEPYIAPEKSEGIDLTKTEEVLAGAPKFIDLSNPDDISWMADKIEESIRGNDKGIWKPRPASFRQSTADADKQREEEIRQRNELNEKVKYKKELLDKLSGYAAKNAADAIISGKPDGNFTREDLLNAGRIYAKQIDPARERRNQTILNGNEDLGDENKYNLEKTGASVLMANAPEELKPVVQALNNETDLAHPKYALAKGWDIVSAYNHIKDNRSTNGWWRTRPSLGQVKRWLDESELKEMFVGNEVAYEELKKSIDDTINKGSTEVPGGFVVNPAEIKAKDVALGGFFNRGSQAVLGGFESVGNIFDSDAERQKSNLNPTLKRGSITGNYGLPGQSAALVQQKNALEEKLKDEGLTPEEQKQYNALVKTTEVRDGWDKFLDASGDVTGQVVLQALLTKGAGLATAPIAGAMNVAKVPMLVNAGIPVALTTYDPIKKQAVYNFPDDEAKQNIYTGTMLLANVLSERIFQDEKIFNAFAKELKGDVTGMLKKLSAKEITKADIKNLVTNKALSYGKNFVKEGNKEAFEEAVVQAVDETAQYTLGAEGYDAENAIRNIGDTYLTTLLSIAPVSALAARANVQSDNFNSVGLYKMSLNPELYKDKVEQMYKDGDMTNEEKNEKIKILNTASQIAANEPPKIQEKNTKERAEYLVQTLNARIKTAQLETVDDKNQAAEIKEDIKKSEERASEIYNSTDEEKPKGFESDVELLTTVRELSGEGLKGQDLQFFVDQAANAPDQFNKEYTPEITNALLEKATIEQLKISREDAAKIEGNENLPVLDKIIAEREAAETSEPDITVSEMIDKPGIYKGERGQFYQDGQAVIFKIEGKNKEYELGNIEEIKDSPISDYQITNEKSVVEVGDDGSISVRGEKYTNPFEERGQNPLDAITYNDEGSIVSVRMKTPDGKRRTFKGNVAEDLAYQINLKEITKDNETRERFEQHINEDVEAAKEMEDGGFYETATPEAVENNEVVSREKIEPKPTEVVNEKQSSKEPAKKVEPVNTEQTSEPEVGTTEAGGKAKGSAKSKEIADKIRKLKVNLSKASGGGLQSNPFGLPIAVWNGSMEVVAKTVEAGGQIADAIQQGLKYINDNHEGKWDTQKYSDEVVKELNKDALQVLADENNLSLGEVVLDFYNWLKGGVVKFGKLVKQYAKIAMTTVMLLTNPVSTQKNATISQQSTLSKSDQQKITDLVNEYYSVNDEVAPKEVVDRAVRLWESMGKPAINLSNGKRPFAGPTSISDIETFEDFVEELSHITQFVSSAELDKIDYPTQDEYDSIEYERPGSMEYDAHKIISPVLANYILTGKTGQDLINSTTFENDKIKKQAEATVEKYIPSDEKNIKEKGKNLADLLRKGKIKSQGLQSNIAGLPAALYNAVIETIATAVEAGTTLAQAIKDAISEYELNENRKFDRAEFIKIVQDATGEKIDTENIGNQKSEDEFKNEPKSILNRINDSKNVSPSFKDKFKNDPKSLKYNPQSHEVARKIAQEIVREFGTENSVAMAEAGRFDGDVNSMIFAESIDQTFNQEQTAATPDEKTKFAEQWADYAVRYDETARQKGKFISAIYDFYKKSPLGVILSERAKRDMAFKEWFQKREKPYQEVFDTIKEEPEFKKLVEEKVSEETKKDKATSRQKRRDKIVSIFDKGKIKGDQLSSSIVPPQIWNAAVEVMKQAALAGESILTIIEAGVNYIKTNHKEAWDEISFKDEWDNRLSGIDGKKVLTDEETLNKKQERILERFRKRLTGLSDQQKEDIIRKSFNQLVDNGALEYDDFKKIIADVMGLGELSAEEVTKLTGFINDINSVQDAADNVMAQTEEQKIKDAIKNFDTVTKKAEKSATKLSDIIHNRVDLGQRTRSLIQLNTLGVFSLIKNVGYNVFNQIFVRIPKAIFGTAIDQAIYGLSFVANKIYGSPILKPDVNIRLAQKGYFNKGTEGTKQAVSQLFTGLTNKDYFQKEIHTSKIKPWTSIKDLWNWGRGKKYLSKAQIADKVLQSTVGIPAEIIARGLNIGDKPFRFAAEGAAATTIGRQEFALKGVELDRFVRFPKEVSKKIYKNRGLSEEVAVKKSEGIEKRIVSEGEQAVFQQENLINDVITGLKKSLTPKEGSNPLSSTGGEVAKMVGLLNLPYVKTPVNIMWEFFNLMNPEIALLQSFVYGIKAARTGSKEDFVKSKKWLSHAATGYSILAATAYIASIGALSGDDEDESYKAKESKGKRTYEKPHSVNLSKVIRAGLGESIDDEDGDLKVDLNWWGPLGSVMNYQANKYENMTEAERKDMSYIDDLISRMESGARDGLVNTTFRGAFDAVNALTSGRTDGVLLNMANVAINLIEPATIAQISRANRKYEYQVKGDNFSEKLQNNLRARFFGKVPAKVNIWGEKMEKGNPVLSMLGISTTDLDVTAPQIHKDFKRTGNSNFYPPAISGTMSVGGEEIKLNTEQQVQMETLVGKARAALVDPFSNNQATYKGKRYFDLDDEEKISALKKLYKEGYDIGKEEFLELYPDLVPKKQ